MKYLILPILCLFCTIGSYIALILSFAVETSFNEKLFWLILSLWWAIYWTFIGVQFKKETKKDLERNKDKNE